ncbi:MAG: porin family protein [Bacteroidota bacterium]
MKRLGLLTIVLITLAQTSKAQVRFGPEAGMNMANMTLQGTSNTGSSSAVYGARVGAVVDFHLAGTVNLQVGALFTMKGFSQSITINGTTITQSINTNYVDVPINVIYKPTGHGLFIGAGPYVGYCLSGNETPAGGSAIALSIGSDKTKNTWTALDFGANGMIGYEFNNGLFFRANYAYGFANCIPGGDANNGAYNSGFSFTAGWLFGGGSSWGKSTGGRFW